MMQGRDEAQEAAKYLNGFRKALETLPLGYSEGVYADRRWGVTLHATGDGRRWWLWGEELGGADRVSFNFYLLAAGSVLRPCEMPAEKVIAFVEGYRLEPAARERHPVRGT